MPPEMFNENPEYEGPPVDVYSLGVVLFTMLTGEYPYAKAGNFHHKRFLS